jgi:hypothetical protein
MKIETYKLRLAAISALAAIGSDPLEPSFTVAKLTVSNGLVTVTSTDRHSAVRFRTYACSGGDMSVFVPTPMLKDWSKLDKKDRGFISVTVGDGLLTWSSTWSGETKSVVSEHFDQPEIEPLFDAWRIDLPQEKRPVNDYGMNLKELSRLTKISDEWHIRFNGRSMLLEPTCHTSDTEVQVLRMPVRVY